MKAPLAKEQVLAFHKTLSNWGRFGERDQLGTLNLITPEKRAAAARLVRTGRTVSASRSLPTLPGPENPNPVQHHMIGTCTEGWGGDYFAIAPHGFATSHIDALCHIFHEGKLYNGSTCRARAVFRTWKWAGDPAAVDKSIAEELARPARLEERRAEGVAAATGGRVMSSCF